MTTPLIVAVTPGPLEVALAWLPRNARIQVPGRPAPEHAPAPVAEVPGSGMGYGAYLSTYWTPRAAARGRHARDRTTWTQACRQLETGGRGGPPLYVVHEPSDWRGTTVLKAVSIRQETTGLTPVRVTATARSIATGQIVAREAESEDGTWTYHAIESDDGQPWWVVEHAPTERMAGWYLGLDSARTATADGRAQADIDLQLAHASGDHDKQRDPACPKC